MCTVEAKSSFALRVDFLGKGKALIDIGIIVCLAGSDDESIASGDLFLDHVHDRTSFLVSTCKQSR